jgi:hypothetical protein
MRLRIIIPRTHVEAQELISSVGCFSLLCPVRRASTVVSIRDLFSRLRECVCRDELGEESGAQLPADHCVYSQAIRVLWNLSWQALAGVACAQRGPGAHNAIERANASCGSSSLSFRAVQPLVLADAVHWESEDTACAVFSFHYRGRTVRRLLPGAPTGSPLAAALAAQDWRSLRCRRRAGASSCSLTLVVCLSADILLHIAPVSYILVLFERRMVAMRETVAMVSTLGGGYFLVKDISRSLRLARQQAWLAWRLGDMALWRASHLHFIYIAIQIGAWARGEALIRELTPGAVEAGDARFLAMLSSAQGYLERTRDWAVTGRLQGQDVHRQALAQADPSELGELKVLYFSPGEEEDVSFFR